jgi:hypothetical protein
MMVHVRFIASSCGLTSAISNGAPGAAVANIARAVTGALWRVKRLVSRLRLHVFETQAQSSSGRLELEPHFAKSAALLTNYPGPTIVMDRRIIAIFTIDRQHAVHGNCQHPQGDLPL